MKRIISYLILLLLPLTAYSQFYATGDDPGRLHWYSIDTENYRIIYPEGNDSLARVYGQRLEKYRIPVSRSSGYLPGGPGRKKMPVVLHTWNSANGSVAWAPKRMDLFTLPSAYCPEPIPWEDMLAVHESRHVTQMQFAMTKALKPWNWLFGEMFNVAASVMYPGISTMEGDAVITETAYSKSGRGRTADFLNYYRLAFDNGIYRSWGQWRFASQRNYSPTYYALGYLTVGGIRTFYDYPEYMSDAYHRLARKPYMLGTFRRLAKDAAGADSFNDVFMDISERMGEIWKKEADARAPYIPMEAVTAETRLHTDYVHNLFVGNDLYSLKSGHEYTKRLIRIRNGKEEGITDFSYDTGKIRLCGNRLYWSETEADKRWSMQTHSNIRYMSCQDDGKTVSGRKKTLTDDKKLIYNPYPSPDGSMMACVSYSVEGKSSLLILDPDSGKDIASVCGPDGIRIVESAWIGDGIYVSGINSDGYGIYRIGFDSTEKCLENSWKMILEHNPVMIKELSAHGKTLAFVSDRTGSDELYHLDTEKGCIRQMTSLRYGGESFVYSPDEKWLYFSSQTLKGKAIFRCPADSLLNREVDFSSRHEYYLAERLSRQEKQIAEEKGDPYIEDAVELSFSEARRYRKFNHMFNVHSWAPVYVNVDNIMNISYDYTYQAASLGATGIIQNRLSTATGEFGYSAHKDPYNPAKWRHSGHARFTYTGLYPVFELSVDFNDRAARQYNSTAHLVEEGAMISITSKETAAAYLSGRIRTYVPFSFSRGGWHSGIIPQLTYSISNDFFNNSVVIVSERKQDGAMALGGKAPVFMGTTKGRNGIMQSMGGSIRGYTMLGTPNSSIYPRWGIGAEIGFSSQLGIGNLYSPMGYAYLYGYVPGVMRTHGLRLSAMYQRKLDTDSPFGQQVVNIMPRGFAAAAQLGSGLSSRNKDMLKLSAEYGIPVYIGDISVLGSMLYIKRLNLSPHFDYTFIGSQGEGIWSAGCNLSLSLESLLWIEWPCSIGVSLSYNGGPSFREYSRDYLVQRWHAGPTFNVTF